MAKNRLSNALATVVPKLEGQMADGRGNAPTDNAPDPSGTELASLRDRYLEHKAIAEAADKAINPTNAYVEFAVEL